MRISVKSYFIIICSFLLSISLVQCKSDSNGVKAQTKTTEEALTDQDDSPKDNAQKNLDEALEEIGEDYNPDLTAAPEEKQEIKPTEKAKVMAKPKPKTEKKEITKKAPPKKTVEKKPAPKLVYSSDIKFEQLIYDWDTISEGDKFDFDFVFTNTGKANLEIYSATATCGCTQPSFPFIEIPPGGNSKIGVKYNSVGKEGNEKASISVLTNVREKPYTLFLEGHVKAKPKAPLEEKEKLVKIISVPDSVGNRK